MFTFQIAFSSVGGTTLHQSAAAAGAATAAYYNQLAAAGGYWSYPQGAATAQQHFTGPATAASQGFIHQQSCVPSAGYGYGYR